MILRWFSPLLFGMLATAQSTTDRAAPPVTFQTGATNVVVDVVVTGGHDIPVEGLSKDNFSVFEDGREQPIVSFVAHATSAAETSPATPALPPGVFSNQSPVSGEDSADVILIDALNTPVSSQMDTNKRLLAYLKAMPPNKPLAVFTLDKELHQLQDFTTDHTALLDAVEKFTQSAHPSPLLKTNRETEQQLQDEDAALLMAVRSKHPGLGEVLVKRMQQFNAGVDSSNIAFRVQFTLSALDELARNLAGIPGRKNVLWLSGSFPLAVLPDPDLKDPFRASRDFSGKVNETATLLARARIAVYPIDARGLFPQSYVGPDIAGDGLVSGTPQRRDQLASNDLTQNAEEEQAMEKVAQVTGGEAISNTNDLKRALEEVDRNGAHYYTLIYSPLDKTTNQKIRKIEVRVHPGKYHLSYRRSYTSAPPRPKAEELARFMQHDVPASAQILFRLSPSRIGLQPASAPVAGSNPNPSKPLTRYALEYDVDASPLALTQSNDGMLKGGTTLVVIAYDRNGKPLNSVSNTLALHVPSAQYANFLKQGVRYRQELDLPAQTAWLRAGVMDQTSGSVGSLEVPFSVNSGAR
jgi:VWFA-related protein